MQANNINIEKLRAAMKQNPELMDLLREDKPKGRPQGAKNKNSLIPGKEIEVPDLPQEEPTPISMAAAKKMLKQFQKPRVYTDEQKAKMLENLAKGRAKRQEALAAMKAANQNKPAVKKYVIKERKPSQKKQQAEYEEEEDEDDQIYQKLSKKEKILQKLNEMQRMAAAPQKRYSLFY